MPFIQCVEWHSGFGAAGQCWQRFAPAYWNQGLPELARKSNNFLRLSKNNLRLNCRFNCGYREMFHSIAVARPWVLTMAGIRRED